LRLAFLLSGGVFCQNFAKNRFLLTLRPFIRLSVQIGKT
jgi:hypothetical protein